MSNIALFPALVTTPPQEQISRVFAAPQHAHDVINSSERAARAYVSMCTAMGVGEEEEE